MKIRHGRLWLVLGACGLILLAISIATSGQRVFGATQVGQTPQKNLKLSTALLLLSNGVKQEMVRPAAPEAVKPLVGFSTETLSKPLRDAIHAGQMRITKNGEVQVYIEAASINPQNERGRGVRNRRCSTVSCNGKHKRFG